MGYWEGARPLVEASIEFGEPDLDPDRGGGPISAFTAIMPPVKVEVIKFTCSKQMNWTVLRCHERLAKGQKFKTLYPT
jgi:hypothetical protein